MKREWIRIISVFLIILSFIQILLNYTFNDEQKKKEEIQSETQMVQNRSIKYKDLSTLNNELSCLKMCQLINASNDKSKWKVKVKITGDSKDILNQMINLKKYEITSYHIKKNYGENSVVLEMYGIE